VGGDLMGLPVLPLFPHLLFFPVVVVTRKIPQFLHPARDEFKQY
jgi:hypothetical protein